MTPITQKPVEPVVVQDVSEAPGPIRAHLPNLTLAALRLVAALMFMQHGVQKFFGELMPPNMPWEGAPSIMSQMWFAGIIEIGGGLLLALGLFTRFAAFIMSGMMAVAYFQVHNPQGLFPSVNGGELAALYCFVFLVYVAIGGGRYSLDHVLGVSRAKHEAVYPEGTTMPRPGRTRWRRRRVVREDVHPDSFR